MIFALVCNPDSAANLADGKTGYADNFLVFLMSLCLFAMLAPLWNSQNNFYW